MGSAPLMLPSSGDVRVLGPGHAPVFRQAAAQLPPVVETPQLTVDRRHEGGQADAFFPEVAGQVLGTQGAVGDHGVGGVVHGGERVHVFGVPAEVLVPAANTDLVRRPVKDPGHVLIVVGLLHAAPDDLEQLAVSLAEIFDPAGHEAPKAGFPAAPIHALEDHADPVEPGGGEDHEQHRGAEGLEQGADVDLRTPGADHGQRPRQDEG